MKHLLFGMKDSKTASFYLVDSVNFILLGFFPLLVWLFLSLFIYLLKMFKMLIHLQFPSEVWSLIFIFPYEWQFCPFPTVKCDLILSNLPLDFF